MGVIYSNSYRLNYFMDTLEDVIIGEANHAITFFFFKPTRAFFVVFFLVQMRVAIHFNDQIPFGAKEIKDVRSNGMLSAKI